MTPAISLIVSDVYWLAVSRSPALSPDPAAFDFSAVPIVGAAPPRRPV
ncbi:MAG: hypothetical protein M3017_09030 [Actinomycetota bacterium]|nr:hypothetical protein [Actinomycetota bacterium]